MQNGLIYSFGFIELFAYFDDVLVHFKNSYRSDFEIIDPLKCRIGTNKKLFKLKINIATVPSDNNVEIVNGFSMSIIA